MKYDARNRQAQVIRENPFEVLYVSEVLQPTQFVRLFSPFLVTQVLALFQPGNVLLKGTVGSGKSMLLDLLRPEIRIAYSQGGMAFPVAHPYSLFIGAGVNLKHLRIDEFGLLDAEWVDEPRHLPLLIADYINWAIALDIVRSVEKIRTTSAKEIRDSLMPKHQRRRLDSWSSSLAKDESWFGSLSKVSSFDGLREKVTQRLSAYRRYANLTERLPQSVLESRTAAGQPIDAMARTLREEGVILPETQLYVRIDQYETLLDLHRVSDTDISRSIRREVNRFLDLRTPDVHFRVGARKFAWDELQQFGVGESRLERERAYREVDLDAILRKPENGRDLFLKFAEDVLGRRMKQSAVSVSRKLHPTLGDIFGRTENASTKARTYTRVHRLARAGAFAVVPKQWRRFLDQVAQNDPLEAHLARGWYLQKAGDPPRDMNADHFPWRAKYWSKEREQQALLQLSVEHQQRISWWGAQDIRTLSGENILVFISICRFIWAAWLRSLPHSDSTPDLAHKLPIGRVPQVIGIEEASRFWYTKILEQAYGDGRQAFVATVGKLLREKLIQDAKMSNPGHNGFSLVESELKESRELDRFLRDAVDAGDLVESPHRTKERRKVDRRKFYLHPVLCPYFQLPAVHTKEPYYASVETVAQWYRDSQKTLSGAVYPTFSWETDASSDQQPSLFSGEDI